MVRERKATSAMLANLCGNVVRPCPSRLCRPFRPVLVALRKLRALSLSRATSWAAAAASAQHGASRGLVQARAGRRRRRVPAVARRRQECVCAEKCSLNAARLRGKASQKALLAAVQRAAAPQQVCVHRLAAAGPASLRWASLGGGAFARASIECKKTLVIRYGRLTRAAECNRNFLCGGDSISTCGWN